MTLLRHSVLTFVAATYFVVAFHTQAASFVLPPVSFKSQEVQSLEKLPGKTVEHRTVLKTHVPPMKIVVADPGVIEVGFSSPRVSRPSLQFSHHSSESAGRLIAKSLSGRSPPPRS